MKKIIIAIIGLSTLTSCRLDLQPESSLTYKGFWEGEEKLSTAHTGLYASFREYAATFWRLGELRSDIWGGQSLDSPPRYIILETENNITKNNVGVSNWAGFYGLLHYVNDFINNAPKVTVKDPNRFNHMMGQAHGLRAQIYFTMLKTWGDVPLTTKPLEKVTDVNLLDKKRSPKTEVAALVKEDIQKSLEYFAGNNSLWNGKNTYWSRAATLALKGEAYIFFGSVLGEGASAYTTAKEALSQISGFALQPTYTGLWGTKNEGNKEFIFAIDYAQEQAKGFHLGFLSGHRNNLRGLYDKSGKSMKDWVEGGGSSCAAAPKILETFAQNPADTRGDATFMYLYGDNNDGQGYPVYNGEKLRSTMFKKFIGDVIDSKRQSFENIPVYRYADVVLLLAEVKNLLGEDPSAEINQIRTRAYGAQYVQEHPDVLYTNGSKEANTKAILDERFKEFVGEGKRWWDLQRAGGEWVIKEVKSFSDAPTSGNIKRIYWPLPIGMIDRDPLLVQTEGYD